MANRFPLVVDSTDNKIKELPAGDSLDFSNVGVANLGTLSVTGTISSANLTLSSTLAAVDANISGTLTVPTISGVTTLTATNATIGTVDATTYTVGGLALSTIQVKSNWNETNPNSAGFILNKPAIGSGALNDLTDVFAASPSVGDIIEYDGFTWQSKANSGGGGAGLTDFSVTTNAASGGGSLSYNNAGVFAYTPANVPTSTSQLVNDSNFITLTTVTNQGYITRTGLSAGAPIAYNNSTGVFTFDNSSTNYTTLAQVLLNVDLDTVLTTGAVTTKTTMSVGALAATSTTVNSTFNLLESASIALGNSGMSSTNGAILLTNGALTLTNGNLAVTSGSITTAESFSTTRHNTPELKNAGNMTITAGDGNIVTIGNYLKMEPDASRPGSPTAGTWHVTNDYAEFYVANADGQGNAGWLQMPCTNGVRGLQIPYFTTTQRNAISGPRPGEIILNTTTSTIQFRTSSGWSDIGA